MHMHTQWNYDYHLQQWCDFLLIYYNDYVNS